jgi:RNA polymerase sigma factor for flagellar operon FliA
VVAVQPYRRHHVIVVDDDIAFLRGIKRAAGTHRDIYLSIAPTGHDALRHVGQQPADLAVVDLFMPDLDGIEVCRRLRETSPHLVVMVASGAITDRLRDEALRAGARRVLAKPYGVPQIAEAASELVADAGREASATEPTEPAERSGSGQERGGSSARSALIQAHLDLARNIAGRLARSYHAVLPPEDIEALARLGLCEAASRFDPERGEPFVAFAERRIRGAVMDEVRRLGAHTRGGQRQLRRIEETRRALQQAHGTVTDGDVAAHLGLSLDKVLQARTPTRVVAVPFEGDHVSPESGADQLVAQAQVRALIEQARKVLPRLDQAILTMHYEQELSFHAIGRALGIGVGRVIQRHALALDRLRRAVTPRSG